MFTTITQTLQITKLKPMYSNGNHTSALSGNSRIVSLRNEIQQKFEKQIETMTQFCDNPVFSQNPSIKISEEALGHLKEATQRSFVGNIKCLNDDILSLLPLNSVLKSKIEPFHRKSSTIFNQILALLKQKTINKEDSIQSSDLLMCYSTLVAFMLEYSLTISGGLESELVTLPDNFDDKKKSILLFIAKISSNIEEVQTIFKGEFIPTTKITAPQISPIQQKEEEFNYARENLKSEIEQVQLALKNTGFHKESLSNEDDQTVVTNLRATFEALLENSKKIVNYDFSSITESESKRFLKEYEYNLSTFKEYLENFTNKFKTYLSWENTYKVYGSYSDIECINGHLILPTTYHTHCLIPRIINVIRTLKEKIELTVHFPAKRTTNDSENICNLVGAATYNVLVIYYVNIPALKDVAQKARKEYESATGGPFFR